MIPKVWLNGRTETAAAAAVVPINFRRDIPDFFILVIISFN
jgi:hypothetical protein